MEAKGKQVHVDSMDEEIVARVAAIDVAKDSGMVCTRVPHPSQPGRRTTTVWSVSARTNSIIAVADRLAEEHVERVVLEATSDYWRPFYYLLEARGLVVWVVNARDVKNVPGRIRGHQAGQDPEHDPDQRATGRVRRPRHSGPLGTGLDRRVELPLSHRDARGAADPVRDARPPSR